MKYRHRLYPGCYFIDERNGSSWNPVYRDNDLPTMESRLAYRQQIIRPGQAFRLVSPTGEVLKVVEYVKP